MLKSNIIRKYNNLRQQNKTITDSHTHNVTVDINKDSKVYVMLQGGKLWSPIIVNNWIYFLKLEKLLRNFHEN